MVTDLTDPLDSNARKTGKGRIMALRVGLAVGRKTVTRVVSTQPPPDVVKVGDVLLLIYYHHGTGGVPFS